MTSSIDIVSKYAALIAAEKYKEASELLAETVHFETPKVKFTTRQEWLLILGESDHASNLQFSAVVCQDPR